MLAALLITFVAVRLRWGENRRRGDGRISSGAPLYDTLAATEDTPEGYRPIRELDTIHPIHDSAMTSTTSPQAVQVAWSILRSLSSVRSPTPTGGGSVDHGRFGTVLSRLDGDAFAELPSVDDDLAEYLESMQDVDPDDLTPGEALAFWLNVYNASALRLAARAARDTTPSVFGLPGAFTTPVVSVANESLSLDDIEHAKIRRFRNPTVHAGMVCGAVSCPTLRHEPFGGAVDRQLDEQMRSFLRGGALRAERQVGRVVLSPIFSWFGGDFTRPQRMPTLLPSRRHRVLEALTEWVGEETSDWIRQADPQVVFGPYDWRLGCVVG